MLRVLPSDLVRAIDRDFRDMVNSPLIEGDLNILRAAGLVGIARLLDQVPDELLTLDSSEYADLLFAKSLLESTANALMQSGMMATMLWPKIGNTNVISIIHTGLSKCPDERPLASTAGLPFVADLGLRESVRLDLSSAEIALRDGSWKAATVLAGASAEALLLWALQRTSHDDIRKATNGDRETLENWTLSALVDASLRLNIIQQETATALRLARDYRNLIHPGRAARKNTKCDRGTAHTAFGAVHRLISDLQQSPT